MVNNTKYTKSPLPSNTQTLTDTHFSKSSLSTPWRHKGATPITPTSVLNGGERLAWSPAALPISTPKITPVHTEEEAGWDAGPVWAFWRGENISIGIQTPDRPAHSIVITLTTLPWFIINLYTRYEKWRHWNEIWTWRPAYKQSKLRIIYDTFDEAAEMSEVQMTASPWSGICVWWNGYCEAPVCWPDGIPASAAPAKHKGSSRSTKVHTHKRKHIHTHPPWPSKFSKNITCMGKCLKSRKYISFKQRIY